MPLEQTLRFLEDASIGLFGAGHLARAIAVGLLDAGLPRSSLAICHRASEQTHQQLVLAGLSDLIAESQQVVRRSRILFYLVRPQDHAAIGGDRGHPGRNQIRHEASRSPGSGDSTQP